jgi:hypothetical protein
MPFFAAWDVAKRLILRANRERILPNEVFMSVPATPRDEREAETGYDGGGAKIFPSIGGGNTPRTKVVWPACWHSLIGAYEPAVQTHDLMRWLLQKETR